MAVSRAALVAWARSSLHCLPEAGSRRKEPRAFVPCCLLSGDLHHKPLRLKSPRVSAQWGGRAGGWNIFSMAAAGLDVAPARTDTQPRR